MSRSTWVMAAIAVLAISTVLIARRAPAPRAADPFAGRARIPLAMGLEDHPDAQAEMEFLMQRDPRTNAIPRDIRRREAQFARGLATRVRTGRSGQLSVARSQSLVWTERGPDNVGGRTRAFAIDVANPTTLIAGSVAGGIWRSTDDGASWSLRTAPGQLHSTTCIAQDRRGGQTGTWYVGTGEIRGSTTNATRWGALYLGDGIFKSTDNGLSWTLLPATMSGTPQTTNPFDYVHNVATNPANLVQDEVLAATFRGIYRSIDGGASWAQVIAADSAYCDVAITPAGVMYATTRNAGFARVWRSTNGTSWTAIQPGSFPTTANRIVIGLAPSNPSACYLLVQGANNTPAVAGHQIWKYVYLSGNGSGAGGTWANRSANLPSDINTQGGYDQVIHVRPDDENFVLIGGTNLYRSTSGFASLGYTTVGGYPYWPDEVHHPDVHAGAFSAVDSKIYYSATDGGVSRTDDITLGSVVWSSLNLGYNVTQFYSVSIASDAANDIILAGAQDNGSQLGNAPGLSDWVMAYGGDGTIVEVSPATDHQLYTQWQGGNLQRQNWDGTSVRDITPDGAVNQMFVNPIVLDPNDSSILYYAAGNSGGTSMVWRNDAIAVADSVAGWSTLPGTNVGSAAGYNRTISALGVSTAGDPNVLYYGTVDGIVMKAVNAHTSTPTVTNITPPGLSGGTAQGGFVRCIAVDPTDSDRALLAFGNYVFQSLWYTTDGGASWTDVEGNLAGASGPSVRWATMFDIDGQLEVFLGTSIGVLSTSTLAGGATVWAQEAASEIGNVAVSYMDYRPSDRTLAVATHGRGVFTTRFAPATGVGDRPVADASQPSLGPGYPNPASGESSIHFDLPNPAHVSLRVFDVAGREVAVLVDERRERGRHPVRLPTARLANGRYFCVLRADGRVATRGIVVRR